MSLFTAAILSICSLSASILWACFATKSEEERQADDREFSLEFARRRGDRS